MKRCVTVLLIFLFAAGLGYFVLSSTRPTTSTTSSTASASVAPSPSVNNPPPASPPTLAAPAPVFVSSRNPAPRSLISSAWSLETQPEFAAFANWATRYFNADASQRPDMLAEGENLAQARLAVLAPLISSDPRRALADAVPMVIRQQLPPAIVALLEARVSGKADLQLLASTAAPGQPASTETNYRAVLLNGREYHAFTYGRRDSLATLPQASIIGIAVGNNLAVNDSPLRVLEPGEQPADRPINNVCPVSGNVTPYSGSGPLNDAAAAAVEVGGQIQVLCHVAHVVSYEQQLIDAEQYRYTLAADGGQGSSAVTGRPSYAWTHGNKKVLIIVVNFTDIPGTVTNPSDSQAINGTYVDNRYNATHGVADFYNQASYGQATIQLSPAVAGVSPDVVGTYTMPQTANFYAVNGSNTTLHADAEAAAVSAGVNVSAYDRVGVVFPYLGSIPGSQITYAGLGQIIGTDFWINGFFDFNDVAHEMGHTFGLNHANLWDVQSVPGHNPLDPAGFSEEYGDIYDVMGTGLDFTAQFTHWNKSILQWIPDTAVTTVSAPGVYRVYSFDNSDANLAHPLALKIARDDTRDYWIGYRHNNATSPALNNSAYVLWGFHTNKQAVLLDMNASTDSLLDAGLAVGSVLNDSSAGITLTTLDQGGTGADQYLDIQVDMQPRILWDKTTFYADEQGGVATLTLSRIGNSVGAVSVNYTTSDGTATQPADYTSSTGTVSWADGDSASKTITIPVVPGAANAGLDTFTVTLSNISGGVIDGPPATTVAIAAPEVDDPEFAPFFINNTVYRVIVQPDGKVVAAGAFSLIQDASFLTYTRGGIVRYNADGTPDLTFGTGGGVTGGSHVVFDFVRQPDGKFIIAGNFTSVNGVARPNVARVNADGSLDTSFDPGTGPDNTVNCVLVQPDGKIVLGGYFLNYNGAAHQLLVRLNADGSADSSFTGPAFGTGAGWYAQALALQPDGKLLVGGELYVPGVHNRGGLTRVNINGSLDSSFSGIAEGATVLGSVNSIEPVNRIALQLDGNIVIGGAFSAYNNVAATSLARVTSTGALDPSFTASTNGIITALLVQPDSKVLVGGSFSTVNGASASHLARVSSTGISDTAFAAGGPNVTVNDFALRSDGTVVYGGLYGTFQSTHVGPMWSFFDGLSGLPGTVQWSSTSASGYKGNSATLTLTRTGGSSGNLSVNYAFDAVSATTASMSSVLGTVSWNNNDSSSKIITVPVAAAGSGSVLLNLGTPLLGGALLGANQQATLTITQLTYALWQADHFTSLEISNPAISGNTADPDGDNLTNLFEYALGRNPHVADASSIIISQIQNISGTNYLTYTFRRRNPTGDLTYTPKTAATPSGPWTADAVLISGPTSNGDGTETVTYRDSTPLTSPTTIRFMRLDITTAP